MQHSYYLYAWVHGADLQDAEGAEIVLEDGWAAVPTLRLIYVDGGIHPCFTM